MHGKGAYFGSLFKKFMNILVAVICACTAMPIEVFAADADPVYLIRSGSSTSAATYRNVYHYLTGEKNSDGNIVNTPYEFSAEDETGTAGIVSQQIVLNGDKLLKPPDPSGTDVLFWYEIASSTGESTATAFDSLSLSDMEAKKITFGNTVSVSEDNTHYYLAPKFREHRILVFKDYDGSVLAEKWIVLEDGKADVEISDVTAHSAAAENPFCGWKYTEGIDTVLQSIYDADGDLIAPTEITITEDDFPNERIELTPLYRDAYWLNFDGGCLAPVLVPEDIGTGKAVVTSDMLADKRPEKSNYVFQGWLDADHNAVTGDFEISEDTTLFADWAYTGSGPVSYKYIYWEQLASDKVDMEDSEKHYSYKEQVTASGDPGDNTADPTLSPPTGFTARTDGPKEISEDGSTVVNIYYDRKVRTINLKYLDTKKAYQYTVKNGDNDEPDVYGLVDGKYIKLIRKTGNGGEHWWYEDESGTVVTYPRKEIKYTRTLSSSSSQEYTFATLVGLYGQTFDQAGETWPSDYDWSNAKVNGDPVFLDAFTVTDDETTYWGDLPTMSVHLYKQSLDGASYLSPNMTFVEVNSVTFSDYANIFPGFTVSQYSIVDPPTGWKTATGTVSGFNELHIRFTRNSYNLIFLYPDGTEYKKYSVKYGADLSGYAEQAFPTTPGVTYTGWSLDMNGVTMPQNDVYVYPLTESADTESYNVIFDLDGGAFPESWYTSDHTGDTNWIKALSTFYPVTSSDGTIEPYSADDVVRRFKPDDDGEYVCIYVTPENAVSGLPHIARYVAADSAEASQYADCLVRDGSNPQKYSPLAISDGTYQFTGWYAVGSSGTASSSPFDFSQKIDHDVVLRAGWEHTDAPFTVVYETIDENGIGGEMSDQYTTVTAGDTVTIAGAPSNIPSGYEFDNWEVYWQGSSGEETTDVSPNGTLTVGSNIADDKNIIHIRAVYKAATAPPAQQLVHLTLHANYVKAGASAEQTTTIKDQQQNHRIDLSAYKTTFSREGYELIGWALTEQAAASGTVEFNTSDQVGAYLKQAGTKGNAGSFTQHLYAVWKPSSLPVTGVSSDTAPYTIMVGMAALIFAAYVYRKKKGVMSDGSSPI